MSINILYAVYGTANAGINVTSACEGQLTAGNDDIAVNNASFGDPDPGATKYFGILYTNPGQNGGHPIALGATEGDKLDLVPVPPTGTTSLQNSLAPVGGIAVQWATYGSNNNGNNVAAICQALINQGNLTLVASNQIFGPDPDSGSTKYLSIQYISGGVTYFRACSENDSITV